eukprot:scaffold3011_cov130-Skeletonema_marinoi.AAC.5
MHRSTSPWGISLDVFAVLMGTMSSSRRSKMWWTKMAKKREWDNIWASLSSWRTNVDNNCISTVAHKR